MQALACPVQSLQLPLAPKSMHQREEPATPPGQVPPVFPALGQAPGWHEGEASPGQILHSEALAQQDDPQSAGASLGQLRH